jgi:hypothetical protein
MAYHPAIELSPSGEPLDPLELVGQDSLVQDGPLRDLSQVLDDEAKLADEGDAAHAGGLAGGGPGVGTARGGHRGALRRRRVSQSGATGAPGGSRRADGGPEVDHGDDGSVLDSLGLGSSLMAGLGASASDSLPATQDALGGLSSFDGFGASMLPALGSAEEQRDLENDSQYTWTTCSSRPASPAFSEAMHPQDELWQAVIEAHHFDVNAILRVGAWWGVGRHQG